MCYISSNYSVNLIHAKSAYLDEWQIREKELKLKQNLDHYVSESCTVEPPLSKFL